MLRPRRAALALAAATAATAATGAGLPAAAADDPDDVDVGNCGVYLCTGAHDGGSPGSDGEPASKPPGHGKPASSSGCSWQGEKVPCHKDGYGSFNSTDGCYYQPANPQPPAGDPMWQGHKPGDGAIYVPTCLHINNVGNDPIWLQNPPGGSGPSPAQLAKDAVDKMLLDGADIRIAPKPGSTGLVGMPVWMWTTRGATTWGPNSATATAGAVSVTATAKVSKIVWAMGDGASVTCRTPGTPYKASYGKRKSPDCGHTYSTTSRSRPGKKFTVTATSTWAIRWAGGGQEGDLTTTRTSETDVAIGELQVLGQ